MPSTKTGERRPPPKRRSRIYNIPLDHRDERFALTTRIILILRKGVILPGEEFNRYDVLYLLDDDSVSADRVSSSLSYLRRHRWIELNRVHGKGHGLYEFCLTPKTLEASTAELPVIASRNVGHLRRKPGYHITHDEDVVKVRRESYGKR